MLNFEECCILTLVDENRLGQLPPQANNWVFLDTGAKAKSAGLSRDLATVKFLATLGSDDRVPPGGLSRLQMTSAHYKKWVQISKVVVAEATFHHHRSSRSYWHRWTE